jgi:serine/threonine protein kinase/tetratricopeptide (TPR) repeat protein
VTPEQWDRIKELYAQALDLSEDERSVFAANACRNDPELRAELESLLKSAEQAGTFLEPPTLSTTTSAASASYPQPGDRLGVYTIVQQIGEGGMGIVYQAVRDDVAFRKLVAVKILKRGMDTDYVLQRFENEKQILAHFDHPNIGKVLDAGITPDQRPFFVMEFYCGLPLDRFCLDRGPTLPTRIRLFQKVCGAVEYAHQNLIVHRDLKPGNILIGEDGEPHLLDFGIAKLLSDERQMTGLGLRVMTPGYASPEQIRGDPVTTSTDIYSLGVLLYEVLTDSHPFPQPTREPFNPERLESQKEPSPPSTLVRNRSATPGSFPEGIGSAEQWSHFLRGDLDKIILKAVATDPTRRYRTVEQFSADLDLFLMGRPVTAVSDSLVYRVTKFARRNRLIVTTAILFVLALASALAVASYEAAVARRQGTLAERHAAQLRGLAESLVFDIQDAIETLPGATPVREKLLKRAKDALENLRANAAGDVTAQIELAEVYRKLGAVHGLPTESNLGEAEESFADYRKAQELLEHVSASTPGMDVLMQLAQVYDQMARVLDSLGRRPEAAEFYRKSIRARDQLFARNPQSLDARRSLAAARFTAARLEINAGNITSALDLARQSMGEYEAALAADPAHERTRFAVALNAKTLAAIETQLGAFPAATQYAVRALEVDRARLAANPKDASIPLDVSFDLSELAEAQIGRKDLPAALATYQQAVAIREDLLRQDPKNERFRDRVAYINGKIGLLLIEMGRPAEAERYIRREFDLLQALAADVNMVATRARLAEARGNLGLWHCGAGNQSVGQAMLASSIAEIRNLQTNQKITFSDALPLARLEKAAAVCGTRSVAPR